MAHDQTCKFEARYCRDCTLQAEARADERKKAAERVENIAYGWNWALDGKNTYMVRLGDAIAAARGGEQA